jgi:hypothetical protein
LCKIVLFFWLFCSDSDPVIIIIVVISAAAKITQRKMKRLFYSRKHTISGSSFVESLSLFLHKYHKSLCCSHKIDVRIFLVVPNNKANSKFGYRDGFRGILSREMNKIKEIGLLEWQILHEAK